jgi:hypothetical protein
LRDATDAIAASKRHVAAALKKHVNDATLALSFLKALSNTGGNGH